MENTTTKKNKLTPEQMYEIFLECTSPQAPVKDILERYNLKPWELSGIRKRIREAAIQTLAKPAKRGRKQKSIPVEQHQQSLKELQQAKDALTTIGYELTLLKKRVD